jgi:Hpt domain
MPRDKQFPAEMMDLFLEAGPQPLAAVRDAVARQDAKAHEHAAHALKGSTDNFLTRPTFEALKLEIMGRQGDLAGAQEVNPLLNGRIERPHSRLS